MKLTTKIEKGHPDMPHFISQLTACDIRCYQNHLYAHIETEFHYWKQIQPAEESVFIRSFIQDANQIYFSPQNITDTIKVLKALPELQHDFSISASKNMLFINLRNGIFDIQKCKCLAYDKKYFFTNCLNFSYVPYNRGSTTVSIMPESWYTLINGSFNETVKNKKSEKLLQILAYSISNLTDAKKAFFLIGPESCGKSLILNLVTEIIGKEHVSSVPFNALGNRFNVATLFGRHINICSEISCSKIKNPDYFKAFVGNDFVQGECKGQSPFTFQVTCKLLTAGNLLPRFQTVDGSNSITDRMEILFFDKTIPVEQRNHHLLNDLSNDRDYIFSRAIEKLPNLIACNYRFIELPENNSRLHAYNESHNVFSLFIREMCNLTLDAKIHKTILWESFHTFCMENGFDVYYERDLFLDKVLSLQNISSERFRINGSNPLAGFKGIELKPQRITLVSSEGGEQ